MFVGLWGFMDDVRMGLFMKNRGFFVSRIRGCGHTFGVCDLTFPARASEPWTLPMIAVFSLLGDLGLRFLGDGFWQMDLGGGSERVVFALYTGLALAAFGVNGETYRG